MGKKLVLTSGDFLSPVVLSNSEDVSCGLLASHLAAAGYTSGRVLLWSLHPRHLDTVGECRVLGGGEAGVQLQLLGRGSRDLPPRERPKNTLNTTKTPQQNPKHYFCALKTRRKKA